jgi:hypothetical protein
MKKMSGQVRTTLHSRNPSAYAIRALRDLCLEIVLQRLENHWPSRQGNLESPGTPGAFFYSLCLGRHRTRRQPCVGRLVTTRPNPVRRCKSRPPVRVPGGRGAYAIRALRDFCSGIVSGF